MSSIPLLSIKRLKCLTKIFFDEAVHIRIASLPGMWERTISLGSAGKTFSVTGWQIGWAVAPPDLSAAIRKVHQWVS